MFSLPGAWVSWAVPWREVMLAPSWPLRVRPHLPMYPFMSENANLSLNEFMSTSSLVGLHLLKAMLAGVPDDLPLPQLRALVAIATEPGLSITDLAERIGVPQQTASRHAAVLLGRYQDPMHEDQKVLVEQRVSREDPRRRALFVTREGIELLSNITAASSAVLKE